MSDMMHLRVDLTVNPNSTVNLGLKWEDCLTDVDHAMLNYAALYFELINHDTWHYKLTSFNPDVYRDLRSKTSDIGRIVSAATFAHKFLSKNRNEFRKSRDVPESIENLIQMWELFRFCPRECLYAIYSNLVNRFRVSNHIILPVYQLVIDILLHISDDFAHELLLLITYDYDPETLMPITGKNYMNDQFSLITSTDLYSRE